MSHRQQARVDWWAEAVRLVQAVVLASVVILSWMAGAVLVTGWGS